MNNNIPINPERRDPSTIQKKSDIGLSRVDNFSSAEIMSLVLDQVVSYVNTGSKYGIENAGGTLNRCILKLEGSCYLTLTLKLKSGEGTNQITYETGKYTISWNTTGEENEKVEFNALSGETKNGILSSPNSKIVFVKDSENKSKVRVILELDLSKNENVCVIEIGLSNYSIDNILQINPNQEEATSGCNYDAEKDDVTQYSLTTSFGYINGVEYSEIIPDYSNITITAKHSGSTLEEAGTHNWGVLDGIPICNYGIFLSDGGGSIDIPAVASIVSTPVTSGEAVSGAVTGGVTSGTGGTVVNPGDLGTVDEAEVKYPGTTSKGYDNRYGLVRFTKYSDTSFSETSTTSMIDELKKWMVDIESSDSSESVISLSLFKKFVSRLFTIISVLDTTTAVFVFETALGNYSYSGIAYSGHSDVIGINSYKVGDTGTTETSWLTSIANQDNYISVSPSSNKAGGPLYSSCVISVSENTAYAERVGKVTFIQKFNNEEKSKFDITVSQKARPWIRLYYSISGSPEYYIDPSNIIGSIKSIDSTVSEEGTGKIAVPEDKSSVIFTIRPVIHYPGEKTEESLSLLPLMESDQRFVTKFYSCSSIYDSKDSSTSYTFDTKEIKDSTITNICKPTNGVVYSTTPYYTKIAITQNKGVIGNDSFEYKFSPLYQKAQSPYLTITSPAAGLLVSADGTLTYTPDITANKQEKVRTIIAKSNYPISAEVSGNTLLNSWLTIDKSNTALGNVYETAMSLSFNENITGTSRTAVIEITSTNHSDGTKLTKKVNITQSNLYNRSEFTFDPDTLIIPKGTTTGSVKYETESRIYGIYSQPDWVTGYSYTTSTDTENITRGTLLLTVSENLGAYEREGDFIVNYKSGGSTKQATLKIVQDTSFSEYIRFNNEENPENVTVTLEYSTDGDAKEVQIDTNTGWRLEKGEEELSWFDYSVDGIWASNSEESLTIGSNNTTDMGTQVRGSIMIKACENNVSGNERKGTLKLISLWDTNSEDPNCKTITINQRKSVVISVPSSPIEISSASEIRKSIEGIKVDNNTSGWKASTNSTFFTIEGIDEVKGSLTIGTTSRNTTGAYRSGYITIKSDYDPTFTETITIDQQPIFNLSCGYYGFTPGLNGKTTDYEFIIHTNDRHGWALRGKSSEVISVFPSSGFDEERIDITVMDGETEWNVWLMNETDDSVEIDISSASIPAVKAISSTDNTGTDDDNPTDTGGTSSGTDSGTHPGTADTETDTGSEVDNKAEVTEGEQSSSAAN